MFSSVVPYKNQHYAELRRNCIKDKKLFEDPEFPATNSSLFYSKSPPGRVEWKRPGVRHEQKAVVHHQHPRDWNTKYYTMIIYCRCMCCLVTGDFKCTSAVCWRHKFPRPEPGGCGKLLVCCSLLLFGFKAKPVEESKFACPLIFNIKKRGKKSIPTCTFLMLAKITIFPLSVCLWF